MKRRFFVGLLAAAALCLPVQAARPANFQVDGEFLGASAYVEEGTTYGPLRELLESLELFYRVFFLGEQMPEYQTGQNG